MKFNWNTKKAKENIINHEGVTFEEAEEVFDDTNAIKSFDALHSIDELRFRRLGLSNKRLLFLIYTVRGNDDDEIIRIISARKANSIEEKFYYESNR